jgi:hypothetical protein
MHDDVNRMGGHITGQFRDGANLVYDVLRGKEDARMTANCIQGEFAVFRDELNKLAGEFQNRAREPVGA